MNYLIKIGVFSIIGNYLRPSNNSRHKCSCFDRGNLLRFTQMVNVYLYLIIFTVFLKNRNFISKIGRSKVSDYAALNITSYI